MRCAYCEEKPAICVGSYNDDPEDAGRLAPACDECCGHGCEDGWCILVEEVLDDGPHYNLNPHDLAAARAYLHERFDPGPPPHTIGD